MRETMSLRWLSAILRAPEPDPDDPGGGGGGDKPPEPKFLTVEDLGKALNPAIKDHIKRLNIEAKITEAIGSLKLDDKFSALTAALEGLKPAPAPAPGGGGGDTAKDEEIRAMKRQLENLANTAETEKAARLQAEANAKQVQLDHEFGKGRSRLYESLKEHADPSLHDVWVDHLVHHKRLKVEEGIPLLEVEYSPVKGMPKTKEYLPLEEALPHLLESTDAKRFMAAPAPADSKNNPGPKGQRGRAPAANPNSTDPQERLRALMAQHGLSFEEEFSG
jgi:hypothetical protein